MKKCLLKILVKSLKTPINKKKEFLQRVFERTLPRF